MFGKLTGAGIRRCKGVQDIVKYTARRTANLELTTALVQSGVSLDAWRDKGEAIDLAGAMAAGFSQVDVP